MLQDQVQRLLDLPLGERVDAGSGLIQDEDGRLLDQHAHQRDKLALPHREAVAALADVGVQALRQSLQPFAIADAAGHGQHFGFGDAGQSVADVIRHGAGEQERHLRDDAQLPAVLLQVEGADVVTVDR